MQWKHADRPVPLPVQALDHATGYLMAAAALRGLALRIREHTAITARLSLARTAQALLHSGAASPGPAFTDMRESDYGPDLEATPWGPARRLRPPLSVGDVHLQWEHPACELGSAKAEWVGPGG